MRHAEPMLTLPALVLLLCTGSGCTTTFVGPSASNPWLNLEPAAASVSYAPYFDDAVPSDTSDTREKRTAIAQAAAESVGRGPVVVNGRRFRMDCSGVARGIYQKAGITLGTVDRLEGGNTNDTRVLFELVRATGSLRRSHPLPGDLAFFDDTYDQNKNGRVDDPLSHVAVVERVEADGTVLLVHRVGGSVVRARMNLLRPHDRLDDSGNSVNHYLRAKSAASPAKTMAELFVAYGSLPLDAPVVDSHRVASR